jgi:hypothetical protein
VEYLNSLSDEKAYSDLLDMPTALLDETLAAYESQFHRDHFIFISHYKKEAGTEATLLEEGFERLIKLDNHHAGNGFRRPVFLDSEDLRDTASLERHVRRTHNLVLLLTPNLLSRPWCLLEMVTAVRNNVEILPVNIQRPGESAFKYPDGEFFQKPSRGETLAKDDLKFLRSKGVKPKDLLSLKKVFQKIATPFSPHQSGGIREAELRQILDRCTLRVDRTKSGAMGKTPSLMTPSATWTPAGSGQTVV